MATDTIAPEEQDDHVAEPALRLGARRREEDVEMDITPMIDVTFLLLIFFLVASKMSADQAVALP
ncbi:MAG: biopolymer transporter ExbD, partial [Planctomycetaceae bacterium]|nr:biopolymer transporter ExbD [Planctomycetaceae bacterium]